MFKNYANPNSDRIYLDQLANLVSARNHSWILVLL